MPVVVQVFDSALDADRVLSELSGDGIAERCWVFSGPEDEQLGGERVDYPGIVGPGMLGSAGENVALAASGLESAGSAPHSALDELVADLAAVGVPDEQAHYFARKLQDGATVVVAEVADEQVEQARAVMAASRPE